MPAHGGAATLRITAARDCTWSATAEGSWLTIKSGANGQGDGSIEVAAATNPDPVVRRGAVIANGQRAEISQSAAACEISLAETSASFAQSGGSGQLHVRASSGMCSWSATTDVDWIQLRATTGQGSSTVSFDVPPSTGPARSGTITIGGQKFSVIQSEGCAFSINPPSHAFNASGGTTTIAITTTGTCPWTAASNVDWIQLAPALGTGPGSVTVTVAPTAGPSRTGTAVVAGQLFTVTQAQGCTYGVQPLNGNVGAAGGTVTVTISANGACEWTATSDVPWITFENRSSGSGDGTLGLLVAATSGPSRTGTATVADHRVTITQGAGCSYSISPESASVGASGGTGKIAVTTDTGCSWTASSSAAWLTITSGSTGSGNGEVQYTAASTSGPTRSGTVTVAGRAFTLNQGQGCTFTLSAASSNFNNGGGQGSVTVQTAAGCGWSVSSGASWITITSPANVTGEGTVQFTVASNAGPARTGIITAGGQTFTVNQGQGCVYALSATTTKIDDGGGQGSFNVQAASGCTWTAASSVPWLTISAGTSGNGDGTVRFAVAANTGPSRSGAITAAGQTFTVTQGSGCSYSLSATSQGVPAAGGTGSVNVSAGSGCGWNATSNASWLSITSDAAGSGNGTVNFSAASQTGPARTGTLTIAGHTFTVSQLGGCTYAINPAAQAFAAGGGTVSVEVTTAASCDWTAASNAPWLTIPTGTSGAGAGSVRIDVRANTGAARSGTVTIAGQTFTASQDSGCTYIVAPENLTIPAAGASPRIDVTTAAECAWTAVRNDSWISIVSAATGRGAGTIDLSVAANTGPARTGTMTVGGRTVTIAQASGCSYGLNPTSQTIPAAGGSATVTVTTSNGCSWTAVSNVPWIKITAGSPGTGGGTVQYTVEAKATGTPRSGTLTIAGIAFTVNQQ